MDLAVEHLAAAGRAACAEAERLWQLDIRDPPAEADSLDDARCRGQIDAFIRQGLLWKREPYKGDGDFAWCGAFAAWCWKAAGLRSVLREHFFASTRRLDKYALGGEPGGGRTVNPLLPRLRLVVAEDTSAEDVRRFGPQPGDLILIGSHEPGAHIALLERYEAGVFFTIEGNGFGRMASGRRREGVVKRERAVDDAAPASCGSSVRPSKIWRPGNRVDPAPGDPRPTSATGPAWVRGR